MFEFTAQSGNGGSPAALLLPFLLLGGLFYFMILRPQQRRTRAQQALVNAVEVGDEIITTAGIYGTVTDIDDDEGVLTVEIAPGTQIRLLRAGVGRRLTAEDEGYDDEDDEVDDPDERPEYPDQPNQIKEL
jgi:preprotein translocase subunit YajC